MKDGLKVVEGDADSTGKAISRTPWMVGVFCQTCGQPWTEKAPCPHCAEFSLPEARIFRKVVHGSTFLPWTWEREYEFSDAPADEGSAGARATPRVASNV